MDKYVYRGKLERVVDGDTIDALIDVGLIYGLRSVYDIWELIHGNHELEI